MFCAWYESLRKNLKHNNRRYVLGKIPKKGSKRKKRKR